MKKVLAGWSKICSSDNRSRCLLRHLNLAYRQAAHAASATRPVESGIAHQ
jgi:hypothetical protein